MIRLFDRQHFSKLAIVLAVVIAIGLIGNLLTRHGHPTLATSLATMALIATIILVLLVAIFVWIDHRRSNR